MRDDIERAESLSSAASTPDTDPEKKDQDQGQDQDQDQDQEGEDVADRQDALHGPLEKTASRKSKHSINNVSSVPNGGLLAWLQVLGAFFLFFNSWGIVNSFGSYQTYYESDLLKNSTPSSISWIGSVQAYLLMVVGALTGPIYDAGYFRHLLVVGSFLVVFGQMMLSLCTEYWQVLLAQAFCIGIGTGCLFVPSVAILSTYFTTRLATATGIAAAGSSIGGVIYPILLHRLIGPIGFPWTARIIGFIALATQLVPNLCMKMRVLPASRRKMLDLPAFKEPPYLLFILGAMVVFMGLYTPFFYVQLFALDRSITSSNLAFYMLSIMNASSAFGRIFPNMLADRIGRFNTIAPCALLSGVLILCLIAVHDLAGLVVFCVLYGFFSGTFVSLPPTILVMLSPDRSKIGTRMGQAFSCIAIGILVGTPIGGAIQSEHGFTALWLFGGIVTIGGCLSVVAARVCKFGFSLAQKT
ncbi:putative major facilitator superfamily protein [Diplodia seriata]|uniref:Putative major facilitator superfamily protein n=1 Tax=Diplodia seriata TaxID=420778 RepID=A0A0G2EFH0_9PEZI|nr:putative major facilitator superfamily protein [Diplodia seriata]